ncbi:MAG: sigma-70 family RNA polymerase sigma factor [Deltaproteobacteria bacterium]|nr:sigma-70 family RNA polymerase sigma factor [Nannocystaceae bacterium]
MDPASLFRHHHMAVFRYLLRRTGDRGAAEELMQETFVRVVRHADDYDERGHERAWLFGIARNLATNWARGRERRPTEVLGELGGDEHDASAAMVLARLLAALPELERELLLLREVAGLDYAEIAETTGLTIAAVRSRLFRARAEARSLLTAETLPRTIGARL